MRAWLTQRLILLFLSRLKVPRDLLRLAFRKHAAQVALMSGDRAFSYQELGERVWRLAQLLVHQGVRAQEPVVVWLDEEAFVLARLAALECGAAFAGFPRSAPLALVEEAIRVLRPRCLLHDPALTDDVADLRLRHPQLVAVPLADARDAVLENFAPTPCANEVHPNDVAGFSLTSGTTGRPKIVPATQGVYLTSMRLLIRNVKLGKTAGQDRLLIGIPFAGAGSGPLLPTLAGGGLMIRPREGGARALSEAIERHRATRLFVTPSQLIDLLDLPAHERHDWSSLTSVVYGTEWMPSPKIEEALRCFGPIVQQGYGCSEVLPPVAMLQAQEHWVDGHAADRETLSSSGRPVPQVRVRIADAQDRPLAPGQVGEILLQSPTVFAGYWGEPELSARALRGGWYHTGDAGYLDAAGRLHVLGRTADAIQRQGRLIYPRLIEEALHDHPAVKETALVQVGERVVMAVSLRRALRGQGTAAQWEREWLDFLGTRVPANDLPDEVRLLDELPRSALQKVLRRELRVTLAQ